MKKLFTIDDFAVAVVAALGYGFGETVARLSGLPGWACIVSCFVVGIASEQLVSRIAFSRTVQKKSINRILTYVSILLLFVIGQYIAVSRMGVSMVDYVTEEFAYVVGLPVLGFIINLCIRAWRVRNILKVYGDGSNGFVFDVSEEEIEEINQQNKQISGQYDAGCAVRTGTGIYVGKKGKKTLSYLGIPYARPPVGELRWKAPEPLPPSESVFEAVNYGPSAIQAEYSGSIIKYHRQSEDCLTLNIWVGTGDKKKKKPVLVLFHHGDYSYGGTVDTLVEGKNFVGEHPEIIFVSFNYRLGVFGFIDLSGIPGGEACPDSLNLGLLDQIAALKWIRENIAAFGGDPDRVTVMGFEAGASSISLLAVSEQAKGLFGKALMFIGSPVFAYEMPQEGPRDLAEELLKETGTTSMEELLRLDAQVLKDASEKLWIMFGPACDGKLIPFDVYRAYKEGIAADIEFIFGLAGNERHVFRSFFGSENYERFISAGMDDILNSIDETAVSELMEYMETQKAALPEFEVKEMLVEQWLRLCIYNCAVKTSEAGNKVHLLYWDSTPLIESLGSGTVDVEAILLGNSEALEMYGNVLNDDLSGILQKLLEKYIKGEALKLYRNEVYGVDALEWEAFPRALIVSDKEIQCDKIDDRLTELKRLYDYMFNDREEGHGTFETSR